jgi:hypothetical protein
MSAPIQVLHPSRLNVPLAARVAVAPIVARGQLPIDLENALVAQHPTTQPNLQVVTAAELAGASPVRLVSTAPLTSDLTAIHAARQVRADLLLIGEVIQADLDDAAVTIDNLPPELNAYRSGAAYNIAPQSAQRPQRVAVAWRVFDVESGRVVGGQTLAIDRFEADREFPDLQLIFPTPRERVLAASARQTWQAITPYLEKEQAELSLPWLQPGASQVRRGNGYARIGRWDMAEAEWSAVTARYPFSNAAKHNLALAQAAREDFSGAKQTLGTLGPLRSRELQSKTLVWLDQRHRLHQAALGLPTPPEGWAFPEPLPMAANPVPASTAPGPDELPLWTAIPFTKPPGWTWRQWIFQPWAL